MVEADQQLSSSKLSTANTNHNNNDQQPSEITCRRCGNYLLAPALFKFFEFCDRCLERPLDKKNFKGAGFLPFHDDRITFLMRSMFVLFHFVMIFALIALSVIVFFWLIPIGNVFFFLLWAVFSVGILPPFVGLATKFQSYCFGKSTRSRLLSQMEINEAELPENVTVASIKLANLEGYNSWETFFSGQHPALNTNLLFVTPDNLYFCLGPAHVFKFPIHSIQSLQFKNFSWRTFCAMHVISFNDARQGIIWDLHIQYLAGVLPSYSNALAKQIHRQLQEKLTQREIDA